MEKSERVILLKTKLLQRNITQRQIAKELNFSESYISMLISEERQCNKFDWWVTKNLGNIYE